MNAQHLSGSPPHGEPEFLVVGKLRKPHGLRGDILMEVITDFPERIKPGIRLFLGDEHQPLVVRRFHWHGKNVLIAFEGLNTLEQAGQYRNTFVYVRAADLPPLPDDEYYHHEIIGLSVKDENGKFLGRIEKILETGANDVYIVRSDFGTEILIPAIRQVVLEIDINQGVMIVRLLPGLMPDE